MGGSMGSLNGSTPIAGWFMMENPNIKWMMTGGSPHLGNIHIKMNRIAVVHIVHVNSCKYFIFGYFNWDNSWTVDKAIRKSCWNFLVLMVFFVVQ